MAFTQHIIPKVVRIVWDFLSKISLIFFLKLNGEIFHASTLFSTQNVNVDDVSPFSIRDARLIVVLLDLVNTAQGQLFKFF